jgi:hypothetical protein
MRVLTAVLAFGGLAAPAAAPVAAQQVRVTSAATVRYI